MKSDQVILLVEDNDDDAELTEKAFREAKISNPIVRIQDGTEAIDYLHGRGAYASRDVSNTPAIVLLDLKLPRMGGLEVLQTLRGDARTRQLPIVILTSSTEDNDRVEAYKHHANSYIQKPVNYDQFVAAARQLGLYWVVLNVPPPVGPS